mgnify:CR=1 FL=1
MKKQKIKVPISFFYNLWNIDGKGYNIDIQILRLLIYFYSEFEEGKVKEITMRDVYVKCYGYKTLLNEQKYLMSWAAFKKLIMNIKAKDKWFFDDNRNVIILNYNNEVFKMNFESKKDFATRISKDISSQMGQYKEKDVFYGIMNDTFDKFRYDTDSRFVEFSREQWELMKQSSINELKVYIWILYEKVRGPYNFISTSVEELNEKLMFNYKNRGNEILRRKLNGYLKKLKILGIIYNYKFDVYNLKVQKVMTKVEREELKKRGIK